MKSKVYGSLTFFIILMFWGYFSSQIILFGACFTHELNDISDQHTKNTSG